MPVVTVGVPVTNIFPPVVVPIAVDLPAFNVIAEAVVFVVVIFPDNVKSPTKVSTKTVPVDCIPVVLPTVPIVNPPLASVKLMFPTLVVLSPAAIVVTLLFTLFNVKVPDPPNTRLLAVRAAV